MDQVEKNQKDTGNIGQEAEEGTELRISVQDNREWCTGVDNARSCWKGR